MIQNDDEVRFINTIKLLKHLPKVSAPPNFESDLMRRINSGNFIENFRARWWDKLFLPSRLIPAAAFALSIVAVFYFLNFNSVERDNPFLAKPKFREIALKTSDKQTFRAKSSEYAEASVNGSFKINKEGFNFLQIRLNETERAKINRLKEQIKAYFNKKQ
jgi:hypothetical protein